jgi:hypothetical protein
LENSTISSMRFRNRSHGFAQLAHDRAAGRPARRTVGGRILRCDEPERAGREARNSEPMFDVITITVLRKSTVRP